MAERKISTRLAIEGESEYKAALESCNAELRTMKSELALVQSQYQNNANHMTALTAKGEALNRMYEAQQSKVETLRAALENAKNAQTAYAAAIEQYKAKIAAAEQELQRLQDGTGDTADEQKALSDELRKLTQSLSEAEAKEQAATRGMNDWQKQLNYAQRDLNNLDAEIQRNGQYMAEAKSSADGCATSIDAFGKTVKTSSRETVELTENLEESASEIAAVDDTILSMRAPEKIKELASTLKACADAAITFEAGMAEVFTLLPNLSEEARAQMSDDMMRFSSEMNVMTSESVPALYQAISAGVPPENVFSFMETAQKAAVGGVAELETTVDGLTSIVNAYGSDVISAQAVSDQLFTAVKLGKTDFEQLSRSIYNVVPTAAAAGISFENVAAALAVITARGVPTATATTQLRQMLVKLNDSGSEVAQTFTQVAGQSFRDFIASGGNLQQALQLLEKRGQKTNQTMQEMFGEVEAGNAALQLTGQATDSFAAALNAMADSAGATDAAYQTMADTTEFAMQRCQVAFENVKTAIGNELMPAITGMADGAASGMDWIGEVIEKFPWVVDLVTVLAGALGVLTVATAAHTVVVQAVAPAWAALTGALSINPFGLIAIAIGAATVALSALKNAGDDSTKSYREMTEASRDAKAALGETGKAIDEAKASAGASAEVAAGYVSRLKELEEQGLKTKDAQNEYAALVEKLNALYPELNLQINENTGRLDENTETLLGNIEAQKEAALAAAFQEQQTELLKQQADVAVEIATNKADLNSLQEQENALLEENNALNERNAEINEELASLGVDDITRREELNAELYNNNEAMTQNAEAAVTLRDEQDVLNEAIAEGTEVSAALNEELNSVVEAQQSVAESTSETADGLEGLSDEQRNAVQAAEEAYEAYATLYDETKAAALESIDKQISQWEKMDNAAVTSAATVAEALQSQITYMQNYSNNMQSLQSRNIEGVGKLAAALADGSTESAAILAGLSTATDDEIRQIVASKERTQWRMPWLQPIPKSRLPWTRR